MAIANGELRASGVPDNSSHVRGEGANVVMVQRLKKAPGRAHKTTKRNHRAIRVNALAGRLADQCRLRFGFLADTPENREIIRADVARRIEGLRRDGDPEFKTMRDHDMYHCAMWASGLFWVLTEDEEDFIEGMEDPLIKSRVRERSRYARKTGC
jgi:hypothetical protein